MNLIEQQNVLKGLTDEALSQQLSNPTGGSPPFLVLAETNRRKVQRERYEGEKARRGKPSTVLEDLATNSQAAPTGSAPGIAQQPQAVTGAPPTQQTPQGFNGPSFAEGGILDYAAIEQQYSDRLNSLPDQRDRARALALISAGAGIMGGKSSNPFVNIGGGIAPAVDQYGAALDNIDSKEMGLMRDALSLNRYQNDEAVRRAENARRANVDERTLSLRENELAARTEANRISSEYDASQAAADDISKAVVEVGKLYGAQPSISTDLSGLEASTGRTKEFIRDNWGLLNKIRVYNMLKDTRGIAIADRYRQQAGLSAEDLQTYSAGVDQGEAGQAISYLDLPVQTSANIGG